MDTGPKGGSDGNKLHVEIKIQIQIYIYILQGPYWFTLPFSCFEWAKSQRKGNPQNRGCIDKQGKAL